MEEILVFGDQPLIINNYYNLFQAIANELMNEILLTINKNIYRICELEFYFYTKFHKDPFIHKDPMQQIPNCWYFHRQNGKGYKSGSFKGLDITFGFNNNCYGGILIRSIKSLSENKIIDGPCNVVNTMIRECGTESISELVEYLGDLKVNNAESKIRLMPDGQLEKKEIFSGPRVGLTLKNGTKEKEEYLMKDYRFLIYPNQIKKYKSTLCLKLYHDKVNDKIKINEKRLKSYIDDFKSGKNKSMDEYYGKKLATKDINILYGISKTIPQSHIQ